MTRWKAIPFVAALAACSSSTTATPGANGSSSVGTACTPSAEKQPAYGGATEQEIGLDTGSMACGGALCLSNHFRGRVSCPYGQDKMGKALSGSTACVLPGTATPVTAAVNPQCTDRTPANSVYCSCRCANVDGKTDDGATYCACPQGFGCEQLEPSIGAANATTAGAYCVKAGTSFDKANACSATCDANTHACR